MRSALADDLVRAELQHGRLAGVDLAADRGLQPDPAGREGLEDSASPASPASESYETMARLRSASTSTDVMLTSSRRWSSMRSSSSATTSRSSSPRRAVRGPLPRGGAGSDRLRLAHSNHLRSVVSTSISGWDQTKRSTSSMISVASPALDGDHREAQPGPLPLVLVLDLGGRRRRTGAGRRRAEPT